MDVTDRDIENLQRISKQVFGDKDYVEVDEVKDTNGNVMVTVEAVDDEKLGTRNAFAGSKLRKYHEYGYVAVAVGGANEKHSAWFERADTIDFGDTSPSGECDLIDDWHAFVGNENIVIKHDDETVAHVARDGWQIDGYVTYTVLPSQVTNALLDLGFEESEDVRAGES
jgi:hypothetical protein